MKKLLTIIFLMGSLNANNINMEYYNKCIKEKNHPCVLEYFEKILDRDSKKNPKDNKLLATYHSSIGMISSFLGKNNMALAHHLDALKIRRELLGENHNDTIKSSFDVGHIYHIQNKINKALNIFNKISKLKDGERSKLTLNLYIKMGLIYKYKSDFVKALEHQNKALSIALELGDNLIISSIYFNLGTIYRYQGKYEKSLLYHMKSLTIREEILGDTDKTTAYSYNALALLFIDKGEYKKAKMYGLKALNIRKNTLTYGLKDLNIRKNILEKFHIDIAYSYNAMGLLESKLGKYEHALEYYDKALEIYKNNNNLIQMDMVNNNIAIVKKKQGKYRESLIYLQDILTSVTKRYGENHINIAIAYNNLAGVHKKLGHYKISLKQYIYALDIFKNNFGDKHPDVSRVYSNMGGLYRETGKSKLAFEYYEKALNIIKELLRGKHPRLAIENYNIGVTYYNDGNIEKATDYLQKALEIGEDTFDDEHPRMRKILDYL